MQKQSKKVYLDIHHAFGSNFAKDSQNSIGVVEEEGKFKVVYLVGKTIAKQAIVGGAMEFISLSGTVLFTQRIRNLWNAWQYRQPVTMQSSVRN